MVLKILLLISSLLILQACGLTKKPVELPKCVGNEVLNKCFQGCFTQRCPTHDGPRPLCLPTKDCRPACICPFNYRRNKQNVCIPTRECPPYKCKGKNQVYNPCPPLCPGEKCADRELKKCPFYIRIILNCNPTCRCRPGFYRDANNNCISAAECALVCGKNEVVSPCNGHCQKTCSVSNPICPRICQQGCVCDSGFVRDDNTGKCIKQAACPKIKCGVNEVRTNCLPACGQETCERVDKEKSVCYTFAPVSCRVGCVCQKNYFRNADDVCTSAADCLKCPNPNEIFGCKRTCDDKECASLNQPCTIVNKRCTEKCYCGKDYARDRLGQCIPISQCPIDKPNTDNCAPPTEIDETSEPDNGGAIPPTNDDIDDEDEYDD